MSELNFSRVNVGAVDVSPTMSLDEANRNFNLWIPSDYNALVELSKHINADPEDLLLVLFSESGLNPKATYWQGDFALAVGLNQITPAAGRAMGISEDERKSITSYSPSDQLLTYVKRYFDAIPKPPGNIYVSPGQLYQANFAPGTLPRGAGRDTILYTRGKDGQSYDLNKALDYNSDGYITVGDLDDHLAYKIAKNKRFQAALVQLRNYGSYQSERSFILPGILLIGIGYSIYKYLG